MSNATPPFQYYINGLQFSSELELPIAEHKNGHVDVTIKYGAVPDQLEAANLKGARHQSARNQYILDGVGVSKYAVYNGNEIIVEPYKGARNEEIVLFLNGSVLAALAHQRGLMPVHGSVVEINGQAIMFSGDSGAGKSTTAAAFQKRGYPLVTDDVGVVNLLDGKAIVYPNIPRLKLWQDSLNKLELKKEDLNQVREQIGKFYLPTFGNFTEKKYLQLAKIFILKSKADTKEITIEPLKQSAKFSAVQANTHRKRLVKGLGQQVPNFKMCGAIAGQCKMYEVTRPNKPFLLNELLDQVLEICTNE
ncbi:HPr kinase/phosphorylase [Bacteroidota bacterium]